MFLEGLQRESIFFHTYTPDETVLWSQALARVLEKPISSPMHLNHLPDSSETSETSETSTQAPMLPTEKQSVVNMTPVTICLHGDLGAGKTVIAKAMIGRWCQVYDVSSPTFNIVAEYRLRPSLCCGDTTKAVHVDLYRVSDTQDIEELDPAYWWQNYCIIEWAGNMPIHLWPNTLFAQHLPRIDITIASSSPISQKPSVSDTAFHRCIEFCAPKNLVDTLKHTHHDWLMTTSAQESVEQ